MYQQIQLELCQIGARGYDSVNLFGSYFVIIIEKNPIL